MSEHTEQVALIRWARLSGVSELDLLFAIPNGGWRHPKTAKQLKAEGASAGIPDLFLPVARDGYHGLWIELKVGRNQPSVDQQAWIEALRAQGYRAEVCWGWDAAREVLCEYLELEGGGWR